MAPNIYDMYNKWESGEVRKEDIKPPFPEPENIVEISIIDEDNLLDAAQLQLLQKAASLPFKLGEYASLAEMLNKLDVKVIIEKGIITREIPHYLDAAILYWQIERTRLQEELRKCDNHKYRSVEDEELERKYRECLQKMEAAMGEKRAWGSMPLRGLYDPKDNVIKLFPEEMASESNGMDELLVSTLAHEAMHAYFNRPGHEQFPYVLFVEEPMAEFGMLVYLAETRIPYFDWAHEDVSSKKTCYRYGAMLYDKYTSVDPLLREDLEDYKVAIDQYDMPIVPWGSKDICMPNPTKKRDSATVNIDGNIVAKKWESIIKEPPRYFWDEETKTLGLDGDWCHDSMRRYDRYGRHKKQDNMPLWFDLLMFHFDIDKRIVEHLYLGENFITDDDSNFSVASVIVSPRNKEYMAINGIPVYRKTYKPALGHCGDGFYEIYRNGKWGIIDSSLNEIIPCKYDCIWSADDVNVFKVRNCVDGEDLYGLVNTKGREVVPLQYKKEEIKEVNGVYRLMVPKR